LLPFTGWEFDGTLGYVDPEYKSFVTSVGPLNALYNVAGIIPFGETSRVTASASGQYSFAPMAAGDLTLRTDWSYIGPKYFAFGDFALNAAGQPVQYAYPGLPPAVNVGRAPGFSDLGAQAILDNVPLGIGGHWMLTFYGKNLLNQYQKINIVDFAAVGFLTSSWYRGRVLGVNLGAKF
jgi:iron complex outermembrane receptor protein